MIFGAIKRLFIPRPEERPPAPAKGISRRTFFSFCTVATIVAAKPDLWLPKSARIPIISPETVWKPVGRVTRTFIQDNVLHADIEFFTVLPSQAVAPVMTVRSLEHSDVGDKIYSGPGGQMTARPPADDVWRACQQARGLRPDEVISFGPGKHPVADDLISRWPAGELIKRAPL